MTDFVADNRPDATVVDSIISVEIKEGGLQDCSWKDNFVVIRVVVRIHRLRRREPFIPVDGGSDLCKVVFLREYRNGLKIGHQVIRDDCEFGVVTPLLWVADLGGKFSEFF